MSFTEDTQILSLFNDDTSLWGQLPETGEGDFDLGSGLGSHLKGGKLSVGLDSFADPLSPESDVSGEDPLPDWMSEKVSLSAWLGDEEDIPMAELMIIPPSPAPKSAPSRAEELFKELLVDISVPPTLPSPGEDQSADALLALSPAISVSSPQSPTSMESVSQPGMKLPSSTASDPCFPQGSDLESQALALLDAMGCMDFSVDQGMPDTQIITVTLPLPQDQTAVEEQLEQIPESPQSLESSAPSSPEESPASSPSPVPTRRTAKSKPKLKNASPIDRKSRKRDQNKNAATRYRVKKRAETNTLTNELKGLEDTNKALKDKVEGLSREIKYLKDLLIEVRLLKGQINTVKTD